MTTKNATLLSRSLKQLSDITRISYNDDIAPVALSLWEKHLKPDNPQWKYVSFQPFYINENGNQAQWWIHDCRVWD